MTCPSVILPSPRRSHLSTSSRCLSSLPAPCGRPLTRRWCVHKVGVGLREEVGARHVDSLYNRHGQQALRRLQRVQDAVHHRDGLLGAACTACSTTVTVSRPCGASSASRTPSTTSMVCWAQRAQRARGGQATAMQHASPMSFACAARAPGGKALALPSKTAGSALERVARALKEQMARGFMI